MVGRVLGCLRAQWMGGLALFLVIAGGTAYAANTIGSADVIDNSLLSADLANNRAVRSADVQNGSLNDEDIAHSAFVNFAMDIGNVNAGSCLDTQISGVDAQGDHLVLTPSDSDSAPYLDYTARYSDSGEDARLVACNHENFPIDDGITHFNLLVIDAQ